MVNLLLTGKATSNCMDGFNELDKDFILKGVEERCEFGFLSIFEHFKYITVGENYKKPIFPMWIVCKEYHYTVIWGKDSRLID